MWGNEENLQPPEEGENECLHCGEVCEGEFCTRFCKLSYIEDNETD